MTTPPDDMPDLGEVCIDLLSNVIAKRPDEAADVLTNLAERWGDRGMFTLCYAMADIIRKVYARYNDSDTGFAQIEMLNGRTPEDLPPESRADLWAARFVVAHLNDDGDNRIALWSAEHDLERRVANVTALVTMTAAIVDQAHGDGIGGA